MTFRKNEMTFHACQLLSANQNPTGKPMYLVCVTVVDPKKRVEWQASGQGADEEDDENPETEYTEETKLKFFDYQAALKADILNDQE